MVFVGERPRENHTRRTFVVLRKVPIFTKYVPSVFGYWVSHLTSPGWGHRLGPLTGARPLTMYNAKENNINRISFVCTGNQLDYRWTLRFPPYRTH